MTTEATKKPWQSGGIVTGIIALALALAEYYGVFVDPALAETLQDPAAIERITQADNIKALLTAAVGIAFIYFRMRATRAISGGVQDVKDVVRKPIDWIAGIFRKKKNQDQ